MEVQKSTDLVWLGLRKVFKDFNSLIPVDCEVPTEYYKRYPKPLILDYDGNLVELVLPKSKLEDINMVLDENQYSRNIWIDNTVLKSLKMKLKKGERYRIKTPFYIIKNRKKQYFRIGGEGQPEIKLYNLDQIANCNIRLPKPRKYNKDHHNEELEYRLNKFSPVMPFYKSNLCYSVPKDRKYAPYIFVPSWDQFRCAKDYYATLLHEIGHNIRNLEFGVNTESEYPILENYNSKEKNTTSFDWNNRYCTEEVIVDAVANLIIRDYGYEPDFSYCAHWFSEIVIPINKEGTYISMVGFDKAKDFYDNNVKTEIGSLYRRITEVLNGKGNYTIRTEK